MATPPDPQRELDQTVRQARLVAFTCCFLAPIMYTYSFGTSVLHGRWQLFFAGFAGLPWADPRVPGSLAAAAVAMTLALLLPPRLGRLDGGLALNTLRLRNLLCCALLVAVLGLFLGRQDRPAGGLRQPDPVPGAHGARAAGFSFPGALAQSDWQRQVNPCCQALRSCANRFQLNHLSGGSHGDL